MSKEELPKRMTDEEVVDEIFARLFEVKKEHAIEFAEFVSNDPVFDDFWSMSKEHQEKIYQQFLTQNKEDDK
jgi:hypothetical protein